MAERKKNFGSFRQSDLMLAVGVIGVLLMLIIPLPAVLLDLFIAVNLMASLMILLTVMFMGKAAEFSVFPSLLLLTTVFRLALNVSSTRLILTQGVAFDSKIIKSFGDFVVGGNYVVGLVIFLIIVAVQFIVITKGATRISEVAARFSLDAMNMKYMAVDQELAGGNINEQEAQQKRDEIRRETDFYGSMDGASKFVKGDVTVGLLITFINIIGGIIIGTVMRGESMSVAAQSYLLFTVGDGLVSQIPALLLSTATGIIVTRAVSDGGLGDDIRKQLSGQPKVMFISGGFLTFLSVLPGFPKIPLFLISGLLFFTGLRIRANILQKAQKDDQVEEEQTEGEPENFVPVQPGLLELEIGFGLVPLVDESQGGDLLDRIKKLRVRNGNETGTVAPPVRIRDNPRFAPNEYSIRIRGVEVGRGELQVGSYLAINPAGTPDDISGIDAIDPAFGKPAKWIVRDDRVQAEDLGYTVVDCPSVLVTHLGELLSKFAPELLTLQQVQKFIDDVESYAPAVVREVREKGAKTSEIQKVLQNLLRERVSIINMELIVELIADHYEPGIKPDMLTEKVRQGLSMQICSSLAVDGVLKAVDLDGELEEILAEGMDIDAEGNLAPSVEPEVINAVIESASNVLSQIQVDGFNNVVICTAPNRLFLHHLFEKAMPFVRVVSYNELSRSIQLQIVGQLSFQTAAAMA